MTDSVDAEKHVTSRSDDAGWNTAVFSEIHFNLKWQ
jgi:hypothetical protein